MKKFSLYLALGGATVGLVFLGFFLLNNKKNSSSSQGLDRLDQMIIFYGEGCPHCLIVDEYLEKNKVSDKLKFEHLEVYKNRDNAALLAESAKRCGIKSDQVGVPLLWNEGKCLVGDKDIVDFLKEKAGGEN